MVRGFSILLGIVCFFICFLIDINRDEDEDLSMCLLFYLFLMTLMLQEITCPLYPGPIVATGFDPIGDIIFQLVLKKISPSTPQTHQLYLLVFLRLLVILILIHQKIISLLYCFSFNCNFSCMFQINWKLVVHLYYTNCC